MTEPSTALDRPTGLQRLLEDLVRDGWLMGMNAGLDPAMTRMDPEAGVYNRTYFEELVQLAIDDVARGRTRLGDGPDQGQVAVLAVQVLGWEAIETGEAGERAEAAHDVAEALSGVLRADDELGRVEDDVFALLLRGCPPDMLDAIARRCTEVIGAVSVVIGGRRVPLSAAPHVVSWSGQDGRDLVRDAAADPTTSMP
jgi:GGDEF domain-containing protein